MKVLFITWAGHNFARTKLSSLKAFHDSLGHNTQWTHFKAEDFDDHLKDLDLAYIWNGQYDVCSPLKQKLNVAGAKVIFTEVAWFPQKDFLYFDDKGTNSACSLHDDSLDWLTEEDYLKLDTFASYYRGHKQWRKGDYIFVPLQLDFDMSIQHGGSFTRMRDFIIHTRLMFPGKKIIFRKHPKDGGNYDIGDEGNGDRKNLLLNCEMVYGLNSTVTAEAALMGIPTTVIAKSFLNAGSSQRDALAAMVAKQVPWNTVDFTPWMSKGRGLEHLQHYT